MNYSEHRKPADEANQFSPAPSDVHDDGHVPRADRAAQDLPSSSLSGEAGQPLSAEKVASSAPVSPLLSQLAELQVRRKFYINLVNKQTNAAKALVRRALGWKYDADETERGKMNKRAAGIVSAALAGKEPKAEDAAIFGALAFDLAIISAAVEPCQKAREGVEKEMKRIAKDLPVYPWAKAVHGLGELGLAVIVGEAGDIGSYPKKGHLWKRLGLAPFRDKAMSSWRREGGLSADEWTAAGYSPRRRAEVYAVIGDPLFRQQSVVKGPYREIYDRRRARAAKTHPDWTKAHSHADGLRVMTKHLVRDLRVAWRRAVLTLPERAEVFAPAANTDRSEANPHASPLATSVAAPSSEPIEQEANELSPHNVAVVEAPTAQTSRRKARRTAPQTAAGLAAPTGDPIAGRA